MRGSRILTSTTRPSRSSIPSPTGSPGTRRSTPSPTSSPSRGRRGWSTSSRPASVRCTSCSPPTTSAIRTGSVPTAAASGSSVRAAATSSTWPRSSTRTHRTTWRPRDTTRPVPNRGSRRARSSLCPQRLAFAGVSRLPTMAEQSFADALTEQISNEFAAQQQYIGAAVYYDSETLPRLAAFFYRQAEEERNHAMIMVQYLLDTDEDVKIPDITSQQTKYDDVVGPVKMALEQEKRVSDEINELFKLAREAGDFRAEQFLTWFVKEQVEEVSSMTDLLNVCEQAKESPLLIEDFLAREQIGDEGSDPSMPPAAGGAL